MADHYIKRLMNSDVALDQVLPSIEEVEAICATDAGERAIDAVNALARKHFDAAIEAFWSEIKGVDTNNINRAAMSKSLLPSLKALADAVQSEFKCLSAFATTLLAACRNHWKANEGAGIAQDPSSMAYVLRLRFAAEIHQTWTLRTLCSSRSQGVSLSSLIEGCFMALMDRHVSLREVSGDVEMDDRDEDVEMKDSWEEPSTDLKIEVANFVSSITCLGLQKIAEPALTSMVKTRVRDKAASLISEGMDCRVLPLVTDFVLGSNCLLDFVSLVTTSMFGWDEKRRNEWHQDLSNLVHESVGMARIQELFEIIVDYPDSLPAAEDLAHCYQSLTSLRKPLVQHLQSSIAKRLLHPGAAATSIITTYINTIRTLSCVDPSGSLLESVAGPICRYVRGRPDAIKCLVSMVTMPRSSDEGEDGMTSLLEDEMTKNPDFASPSGHSKGSDLDPDPDGSCLKLIQAQGKMGTEGWERKQGGEKKEDIVGLLVGIFGTPDVFISEYRTCLGSQLLHSTDFSCESAVRIIELLKLRFGESAMHSCEIMLKDCADSKRTKANIHLRSEEESSSPLPFSALITSHLYWPELNKKPLGSDKEPEESKVALPPQVKHMMKQYSEQFTALKTPRMLKWRPQQGVVDLQLEAGGVTVLFKVSPIHATLLLQFKQGGQDEMSHELSLLELSKKVDLSSTLIRSKMAFWTRHGVVIEKNKSYHLSRVLDPAMDGKVVDLTDVDEDEDEGEGGQDPVNAMLEAMLPFENYINGMLTNYKQMSLEKLHSMLKMFVMSPKYDRTTDQLAAFLAHLMTEGKVVLDSSSNLYKKPVPPASSSEN